MAIPLLLLVAAAVAAYLSVVDRMSALALALVEVETQFGFAVWPPLLLAGLGVLLLRVLQPKPANKAAPRPHTRDAHRTERAADPANAGGTWLESVRRGARGVSDDPMGRVRFDEGGASVTLQLTAVTREQARRRVAAYAAWLATIPVPPTARVRVVSSPDLEGPLHGLYRGELTKHFPAEAFTVTSNHEGADAVFAWPDPRWKG